MSMSIDHGGYSGSVNKPIDLADLEQLDGRTVTFESLRYPDWFLDGRDKPMDEARISPLQSSVRHGIAKKAKVAKWPMWKVILRDEGLVSLESMHRKAKPLSGPEPPQRLELHERHQRHLVR